MKRLLSILFLLVYLYNFAGYLAIFTLVKGEIQGRVRERLKENIPDSGLTLLAFHTLSFQKGMYAIGWSEDDEFRFAGKMYDVVRSYIGGDSTYYVCLEDTPEERLFASFDESVRWHIGDTGNRTGGGSLKDMFKDSLPHFSSFSNIHREHGALAVLHPRKHDSVTREVPIPPPRHSSHTVV